MLRRIINNLVLHRDDVVIMDRRPVWSIWAVELQNPWISFIVVIEPGARSGQTYKNVKRLADDLGVNRYV